MEEIKVFEMFAGYGGASFALHKAKIKHKIVGFSEIDKFAIKCYEQNHYNIVYRECDGQAFYEVPKNFGDCTKINPTEIPDFDLLTGGFPCQAFSIAGKGLGELDTRGTLFHEIIRIAEVKKPKWMLLENVKGLTSKKHKATYDKICDELDRIGYDMKIAVLNSKDYGIPQNRERVFFVCWQKWLGSDYGKSYYEFNFPEKEELKIRVKDVLDSDVNSKYFLNEQQIERLTKQKGFPREIKEVCSKLLARDYKDPKVIRIQYDVSGKGYKSQQDRIYYDEGIMCCLPNANPTNKVTIFNETVVRRLTPKECFRLMGFLDDEINLCGFSDTQLYKLAGNGWDINLVSKIFKNMFT